MLDSKTLRTLKKAIDGVVSVQWNGIKSGGANFGHWTPGDRVGAQVTARACNAVRLQYDVADYSACVAVSVPRSRKQACTEQCITIGIPAHADTSEDQGWTSMCILPCVTTEIFVADAPSVAGAPATQMSRHTVEKGGCLYLPSPQPFLLGARPNGAAFALVIAFGDDKCKGMDLNVEPWLTDVQESDKDDQRRMEEEQKRKQKEKLNAAVFFDKNLYEKLKKEVPNYKLITASVISERMKCNTSMARRALTDLELKGMIKCIMKHGAQSIYTRALTGE